MEMAYLKLNLVRFFLFDFLLPYKYTYVISKGPEVATTLYPHQKRALTFLLEREREIIRPSGSSSLWQKKYDPSSGRTSWFHVVTQKESFECPQEAKSAILADDVNYLTSKSFIFH